MCPPGETKACVHFAESFGTDVGVFVNLGQGIRLIAPSFTTKAKE